MIGFPQRERFYINRHYKEMEDNLQYERKYFQIMYLIRVYIQNMLRTLLTPQQKDEHPNFKKD